jgi:alkylation response protein AidB-like acyl-CoA dehydrogenase
MPTLMPLDDRQAIREVAVSFFAGQAPLVGQAEAARSGAVLRRELFAAMADLDFLGQSAPESAGGLGLSPLASGLVAEAAGAELVPGPLLDQLVAIRMAGGDDEVVRALASGERLAAVHLAGGVSYDRTAGTVSGQVRGIRFATEVDWWVLAADGEVVVVAADADGIGEVTPEPAIDPLWSSASARLAQVPVTAALDRSAADARDDAGYACGLVAAYSIGAAQRLLDDAVAYVKDRQQFGRPVGAFQAVKHRAANAHIALLHARSLVYDALEASEDAAHRMRVARVAADAAYRLTSENALQMHGGIGFTAESTVHLFLKNAQQLRAWPVAVGDDLQHVRDVLGLDRATEETPA